MSDRTGSKGSAKARANRRRMGRAFFDRSPEVVARELLGKVLRHKYKGEWLSGRIVEVEAYLGLEDPASTPSSAGPRGIGSCSDLPGSPMSTWCTACTTA